MRRLQAGNSLMGVIVAFLIVVVATVFFVTGGMGLLGAGEEGEKYEREDGLGNTTIGRARYAAEDAVCRQQLGQVRGLLQVYLADSGDVYPASLDEVGGMPAGYAQCPIGSEPYEYDPATGKVECVHPGHEKY